MSKPLAPIGCYEVWTGRHSKELNVDGIHGEDVQDMNAAFTQCNITGEPVEPMPWPWHGLDCQDIAVGLQDVGFHL